jgi:Domain of unknown function (DUF4440)
MANDSEKKALIRELEDRRYAAMIAGDVETLDTLISDQALYAHSFGDRDTKQQYLDKVRAGRFIYHEITRPEEDIRIEGDAAIVAGRMKARVMIDGAERLLNNSSLAVWACSQGSWRLLAYQPTVLPTTR